MFVNEHGMVLLLVEIQTWNNIIVDCSYMNESCIINKNETILLMRSIS